MPSQTSPADLERAATEFTKSVQQHARSSLGQAWEDLSKRQRFTCVSLAVRDRVVDRLIETQRRYREADPKRIYYLSIEYLVGRSLANNLSNLGVYDVCQTALTRLGVNLNELEESEEDAGLGNGGLGRLAVCFLDSMSTLGIPGYGYGINYEYGLFRQEINGGSQVEKPDNWLAFGNPWEILQPEAACLVPVYGHIEPGVDRRGNYNPMWLGWRLLVGVPHDFPIVGYGGETVNLLRLYSARASHDFDMQIFNAGDYLKAVEQKLASETVSKVLYPSDAVLPGQELRLVQEYFLVACALRDIVRRYERDHQSLDAFASRAAIHLNDTHPALMVAELMRFLIDERDLPWDKAWDITQATIGYTNHTLMPEALERWPVALLERVVPRHLEIIYEINRHLLEHVSAVWPGDQERLRRVSLIDEGSPRQVRMAHLCIAGSHSTNGVSAMHSELVKSSLAPDFVSLWPERFNNKTNGVTPRRWLVQANPGLAELITSAIGPRWITDLESLRGIEPCAHDEAFQHAYMHVKRANKQRLAAFITHISPVAVNPDSLFDVHVKRIHEYKRQLLNVMHIIHEYLALVEDECAPTVPRTYVFAGKAAPGYWVAKQIIRLINSVASVINADPRANEQMKVVFLPDYRVSLAELIIPAADLSEQISTAGTEASGTGNMKLAMNGALTIGTLDGANAEIRAAVGEENFFLFGLTVDEIQRLRDSGSYRPREVYEQNPAARRVLDALASDRFSVGERGLYGWIRDSLLDGGDPHYLLADFADYLATHDRVGEQFRRPAAWATSAILNTARMGQFSSDRAVAEYARDIWHVGPITRH